MEVECFVCYEGFTQEQRVSALDCGHVCCSSCLEEWVDMAEEGEEQCPVCRYKPPLDATALFRPLYLRFREGGGSSSTPPQAVQIPTSGPNLQDVLRDGQNLQNLLQGLVGDGNPSNENLQRVLAETERIKSTLQGLQQNEKLREILNGITIHLAAITAELKSREELPGLRQTVGQLGQRITQYELQVRNLQVYAHHQAETKARIAQLTQDHGAKVAKMKEVHKEALRTQKEELTMKFTGETSRLYGELDLVQRKLSERNASELKLKSSILEHKRKLEKLAAEADEVRELRNEVAVLRAQLQRQAESTKNVRQPLRPSRANLPPQSSTPNNKKEVDVDNWLIDIAEDSDIEIQEIRRPKSSVTLERTLYVPALAAFNRPSVRSTQPLSRKRKPESSQGPLSLGSTANLALGPKRSRRAPA